MKTKEDKIICLGIESTAHTFGVGIVDEDGRILADQRIMYKPERGKGILPRDASEHHMKNAFSIIKTALRSANKKISNIDIIAYSQGPGLPPCLNVGAAIARYLALSNNINIVGVNHPIGHIEIGKVTAGAEDPVVLYLSGGNTQVIAFTEGRYRIFGETQDIAIGNAFDSVARILKLSPPGGPEIERLAKGGSYVELPYIVKGMDVSFSGIVTDVEKKVKSGVSPEDLCYSLQETSFAMMIEVTERALAHTDKKEVLLVGGVAANKRLQEMLNVMCEERGAKMYVVDTKYSGDNGSMIAWTGFLAYKSGQRTAIEDSKIKQKWKTDQVEISWI
jgi:N6-L-threonylcarbamoyladenine synthase/protein kinase Bud32